MNYTPANRSGEGHLSDESCSLAVEADFKLIMPKKECDSVGAQQLHRGGFKSSCNFTFNGIEELRSDSRVSSMGPPKLPECMLSLLKQIDT